MADIQVMPEYSALGVRKKSSKALHELIEHLGEYICHDSASDAPLVVDQGCGQLRNVEILLAISSQMVLVDTERQLKKKHSFYGQSLTVYEFVPQRWSDKDITILTAKEFSQSSLAADVVFSINVLDVVLPETRDEILHAAHRNLSPTGVLAVFVPRNDTWTLRRCKSINKLADGYVFPNHGVHTFYHNWTDSEMQKLLSERGFTIVKNLSMYRHLRLLCMPV